MTDVIWLPSWYPSQESPQNGDFIYRHALAVSNHVKLKVLFNQSSSKVEKVSSESHFVNQNFQENVLLFPKRRLRFLNFFKYYFFYKKQFKQLYWKSELPRIIHVHVSFRAGLIALAIKKRYNIRYVISEHWSYFNNQSELNYSNCNFYMKWIFSQIFKNADCVLPVSNDLACKLHSFFPFIETKVIRNVVDSRLFYYCNRITSNGKFRFIHVSSLIELKNPIKIIRVFSKIQKAYDDVVLQLVGPESPELINRLADLDILNGSVIFCGLKEHEEVASLVRGADAFVLFSKTENLPCAISESLCCGVPVISSSVGGIPEMIDDSNGILVAPGDEDALYNAMESMIKNYSKYDRKKISQDAQAKYNPEVVGKQIVEVYEKVLAKK